MAASIMSTHSRSAKVVRTLVAKFFPIAEAGAIGDTIAGLLFSVVLMCLLMSGASLAADQNESQSPSASGLGLGRELHIDEITQLSKQIFADGTGLPDGQGSASDGFAIYAKACAMCHGGRGEGGRALELVGDRALLATEYPDKGIAVYWPYAPTLFGYIQHSMPPDQPFSLSNNEVYSVIAALLVMNGLIDSDASLDATSLSALKMPNVNGFNSLHRHPPVD